MTKCGLCQIVSCNFTPFWLYFPSLELNYENVWLIARSTGHRRVAFSIRNSTRKGQSGTPLSTTEGTVSIVPCDEGFLLLDIGFNLIASNDSALQILCFPSVPDQIKQPNVFLAGRIRMALIDHKNHDGTLFVKELKSGKRRYTCKSFQVGGNELCPMQPAFALLLERSESDGRPAVAEIAEQFNLTQRECETVEFILQGLTSKEIATRMNISPNTVKAFLRLVMVKMNVSTRSGIAGKVAGTRHGIIPQGVQLDAQRNSIFRKQAFYRQTHSGA